MVNARGCLPALFWRREEPRSPSARAQCLNKKPRTVAGGIGWWDRAGPFAAIDQHHRRAALGTGGALHRPVAANVLAVSATVAALNWRLPFAFCQRSQRVPPSSRVK